MWWFILTAIVFALQLFPLTGVFLMIVAAPFWSVITVNLGFASLIPEVLFRRISPAWLLLPALWFGGYAGAVYLSEARVAALDAEVRTANSVVRVTFDAAQQSLVIRPTDHVLSNAASTLVSSYRLPAAHTLQRDGGRWRHRASRLMVDPHCHAIRADRRYMVAGVHAQPIYDGNAERHPRRASGICIVTMPEEPVLPTVLVEGKQEKHADFFTPYELTRLTISDASGNVLGQAVSGSANPLSQFPMPVIGCALNSGAPSWDCMATFWRRNVGIGGEKKYGQAAIEVLPRVLGLEASSAIERRAEILATPEVSPETVVNRSADEALATLDAVIADPTKRITYHDVSDLREDLPLFHDRIPAMITAISRALANGTRTYETARVLQQLLAQLPGTDFVAIGAALLEVLNAEQVINDRTVADTLATRLGELGSPALPVLDKLIFSTPKRPALGAIYGLCRVGSAAADRAEQLAVIASDGRRRDHDAAIFVTLRRMGREDLIARERAQGTRFSKISKKLDERTITPESPLSACTNERGYPNLPS
jgi:hypothetical protein